LLKVEGELKASGIEDKVTNPSQRERERYRERERESAGERVRESREEREREQTRVCYLSEVCFLLFS